MKKFNEILSTAFFAGYFPFAPGTAGTLVGMAIYVFEYFIFGEISWLVNFIVIILFLYPSVKISDAAIEIFNASTSL